MKDTRTSFTTVWALMTTINSRLFCAPPFYAFMILMAFISPANSIGLQELHRFEGNLAGQSQATLIQANDGILYGTTVNGGAYGFGTIFQITTNGALNVLASFASTNGANPYGNLIQASDGNFYGTTQSGGQNNLGTIFKMSSNGVLNTLVSFTGSNGAYPRSGLIQATDGNLYGTTVYGGITNSTYIAGMGTVFQIAMNGTMNTIAYFNGTNGELPYASLIQAADGYLYGTTANGGDAGAGTVFKVGLNGSLSVLYSFDITHGASPYGSLIQANDGSFYGTTSYGGTTYYQGSLYGTVFRLTTNGVISTIFSFDYNRGGTPMAGLVSDSNGILYGTTKTGGANGSGGNGDYGTVFQIKNGGLLSYSFYGTDGWEPLAGLVKANDGNYYGATFYGNNSSSGMIYRFRTNGVITMISCYASTNGAGPVDNLLSGEDGCLYGTTTAGGDYGRGIFYRMTTNGVITKLASFLGSPGDYPSGKLAAGGNGLFYGISSSGRVYKVNTNGTVTTLSTLSSSTQPNNDLIMGADNALYGTTREGGASFYYGSVFRVTTNGSLSTLYSFTSSNAYPDSGVSVGADGNFYGTTMNTVYRCTTGGVLTTLLTVKSNSIYQGSPYFSELTIGSNGMLYAMTVYGGNAAHGPGSGYGTVIQVSTNGDYTPLLLFNGTNGMNMVLVEAPVLGNDGALYGISPYGGIGYNGHNNSGKGVAFRLTTNGTFTPLILCDTNTKVSGTFDLGNDGQLYGVGYQNGVGSSGGSIFRLDLRNQIFPLTQMPDGVIINFNGLPDDQYQLLRTTNLSGIWEILATLKADSTGFFAIYRHRPNIWQFILQNYIPLICGNELYFAHRLPRHGQTSARRLRVAGKRTALARWTRLRRPRPAVDGGEATRHPAV
jgi:uncharacterized repeat protein (TIGR03803 family)